MSSSRGALWLAVWGGVGYSPVAPGTAGSLAAVVMGWAFAYGAGLPAWTLAVPALLLIPLGAWASRHAERALGRKDPGSVVVDEVCGQWLALLPAPSGPWSDVWFDWLLGFGLFRLFDVWKPGPIRRLERLGEGYGVMADDVGAGLCAMIILGFYRWFW